jgi:predicted acyl esterase
MEAFPGGHPRGSARPAQYLHDANTRSPVLGKHLFSLASKQPGEALSWEDLNAPAGSRDQRVIEGQCLTFTSPPLEHDLEVTGPVLPGCTFLPAPQTPISSFDCAMSIRMAVPC